MPSTAKQKTVIVGAGPVGALAALYAARRGHEVEIYELRGDLREASTTPLNFTKSINLALSERGIFAMKESGCVDLVNKILDDSIPMYGRMIHGRHTTGNLFLQSQQYEINKRVILPVMSSYPYTALLTGQAIQAVDRTGLNSHMLNELEKLPNVTFFFHHKLTGADFNKNLAWFHRKAATSPASHAGEEIEVSFDFLLGADGAHSSVRYNLMKYTRVNYNQEYISTLWCEFRIPPSPTTHAHMLSPNYLHIWPGREFMFIAIPSLDKSFTCTLFLPAAHFASLSASPPSSLLCFFSTHFPGVVPDLITPDDLVSQFQTNPHLPLISIKCTPYHYSSSVVIVGDAAHAMVPFYGQGMNAGLEDVRVLYSHLDQHPNTPDGRAAALEAYTQERTPDAHMINDLALRNYTEMRSGVTMPLYKARKAVEEWISKVFPSSGWRTQYARVSFGIERYSEVKQAVDRQGRLLAWGLAGGMVGVVGAGVGVGLSLWKRGGRR